MADVKWIKLSTDIFNNRKIRVIETMPEGYAIIVVWVKLLCLAGTTNDGGQIYLTTNIPYTEQTLAAQFNMPLATVQLALATFEKFEMIERVDDFLKITNWEKYQNVQGLEKVREQTRNRVARYRQRQKTLPECTTNDVTLQVTQCNATDIDIDIDIDKDIDKDKIKSKSNKFVAPTLDEVTAYCNERHNNVDANRFIDYYTSNGWMVGKNKMKDWRAAVRNWERGNNNTSSSGSSGGDKFMQGLKRIGAEIYGKSETDY